MNLNSEISWEEVEKLVDEIIFEIYGRHLTDVETKILQGAYEKKKYGQIEDERSDNYLKEVGKRTWDVLTGKIGEKVNKSNFVQQLLRYKMKQNLDKGSGGIYIERPNVDRPCKEAITKTGALIRIKSPAKMGKTLLLGKLLEYAENKDYKIAKLDFKLADSKILTNLSTFLQWLCSEVSNQLETQSTEKSKLEKFWTEKDEDDLGAKQICSNYFQHLLQEIKSPLVLAIDNCEVLFDYREIYLEFFPLLRSWNESAKQGGIGNTWTNLRIVLVYSTEEYLALDINSSPFNVGLVIELPDFELSGVKEFAEKYELNMSEKLENLMDLVGGHPSLIDQAFFSLKYQQKNLEELITLAPTYQGIYGSDLRQQLQILEQNENSDLKSAYQKVVKATEEGVKIDSKFAFKLHSLGLVKFKKNNCIPSYKLYQLYFSEHFNSTNNHEETNKT
jgi:AAA-like domain